MSVIWVALPHPPALSVPTSDGQFAGSRKLGKSAGLVPVSVEPKKVALLIV
jgi:hypothetical protein